MSEELDAEEAMRLVDGHFGAWMARDPDRMDAYTSDDFIMWHSMIRKEFTKAEHHALLLQVLEVMQIDYHSIRRYPIEGGVAMQCLGNVRLKGHAEAKNVPFALIYRVRDGKIYRCDEYIDGMSLPRASFNVRQG